MSSKMFTPSAVVAYFQAGGFDVSKQARFYFRVYTCDRFVCGVHVDKKGQHIRLTTELLDATVPSYSALADTLHKLYLAERDRMNAVVCGVAGLNEKD